MSDYIKVGNGKKVFNDLINFSVNVDKLKEHTYQYEGANYVNLTAKIFKEKNKYGKDVVVNINQFKPEQNKTSDTQAEYKVEPENGDLPF
jgi:hypothetical protein